MRIINGRRAGFARKVAACAALLVSSAGAVAQQPPPSTDLPPVTVEAAPVQPVKKIKKAKKSAAPVAVTGPPANPSPTPQRASQNKETGTSPVNGFVAGVSATATKTDTPLLTTPQAVSVVTRDQMEQQGAQSVKEALQYTSGVAADTRTAFAGYDIVYSRGFVLDRYLDSLKYLGGANYTTPQIELYGLERLEVLHGPASMLYGASSPGGIVNAVSKRPTDEPFHELQFQFGNFGHLEAAFDFSGPVTSDKRWLYRLSGLAGTTDSQVDFNEQERYWIAPSLTYRDADTTFTFLANLQHDPEVGLYSNIPPTGSLFASPFGRIPRDRYLGEPAFNTNSRDQESVGYALEHRIDETWKVRQNLRYMHTDGVVQQFMPLDVFGTTLARFVIDQTADIDAFQVDTNIEGKFRTGFVKHTLLFGVDYQNLAELGDVALMFGSDIDIFNPVYGDVSRTPFSRDYTDQRLDQTGLYIQDQMEIDRLVLTLGLRKDFADITTDDLLNNTSTHQDDEATTERVGVTYLLGGGLAPYASYSTSFQPTVGVSSAGTPYAPTTAEQYEVGIKYQPIGYDALFTLAAYDLTQQNVLSINGPIRSQIGEVQSRGIEFEGKMSLSKELDVIGSYTRSETEVTKTNIPTLLGRTPVNIPGQTAALWAFYTFRSGALDGFGLGGGVRYVDQTPGDQANTFFVPGYTLLDAAAKYDLGNLAPALNGTDLQLNVSNVFDKEYVSQCTNTATCLYGNGRTVITTLKYHW
jgi:iron complex outermembrane receptor protein